MTTGSEKKAIDPYSLSSFYIVQYCNGNKFGVGTGFLYRIGQLDFLVSNWHVFSGRNFFTKALMSKTLFSPDKIRAYIAYLDNGTFQLKVFETELFDSDGSPRWFVHPRLRNNCDIAVMPIDGIPEQAKRINKIPDHAIVHNVGDPVFVVGFPYGRSFHDLPIWKKASLATEPQVPNGKEYFLIDTASRPGMSGSPVVSLNVGQALLADSLSIGGVYRNFIGIYSGRTSSADENDAQLGFVWPRYLISQTITFGQKDENI